MEIGDMGRRMTAAGANCPAVIAVLIMLAANGSKADQGPDVDDPVAIGLCWESVDSSKPFPGGKEIKNPFLLSALRRKHTFTRERFEQFGISNLAYDSYIKVGRKYLTPSKQCKVAESFWPYRDKNRQVF